MLKTVKRKKNTYLGPKRRQTRRLGLFPSSPATTDHRSVVVVCRSSRHGGNAVVTWHVWPSNSTVVSRVYKKIK